MRTIWRVEDVNNKGCYIKQPTQLLLLRHNNKSTHPTPHQDLRISRAPTKEEISGFLSKEQAMRWFTKDELDILKHVGFELKEVPVVRITESSYYQALALR